MKVYRRLARVHYDTAYGVEELYKVLIQVFSEQRLESVMAELLCSLVDKKILSLDDIHKIATAGDDYLIDLREPSEDELDREVINDKTD